MLALKADHASGYRLSAVATLAAAVAGITSLSGLIQLRVTALRSTPLIEAQPLPAPSWPHEWLAAAQTARSAQAEAVTEWLNVVLVLVALIVAIAGISSLIGLFAYATSRRYEVALAAVVGASRTRLRMDQLQRAAVNASIALGIGVSSGLLVASVASRTWPHDTTGTAPFAWLVLSVVFAGSIAAVAGRAAAARMARPGWLGDALAPEARTNPGYGAEDLRRALLHAQFAFTFALLTAAMLVAREAPRDRSDSFARGGYVTRISIDDHVLPAQRKAIHAALREQAGGRVALATPGALIGIGATDQIVSHCGRCVFSYMYTPVFALRTQQHVVSDGFFATAGFDLLAGREFESADDDAKRVLVNDTFANMAFQGQHAIGKQIQIGGLGGERYTVIGVVEDVPVAGVHAFRPDRFSVARGSRPGHEPAIYFNAAEKPPSSFEMIGDRGVRVQMAGVQTVSVQRRSELLYQAKAPAAWFAGILAVLALAASIVALFSLASITLLNVRQQELEIASRRAVGARRRDIIRMIIAANAGVVGRGTAVGVILSVLLAHALQMVLPSLQILNAETLVVAGVILSIVLMVAAIIPARAAAGIPPARVHV